MPAVKQAGYRLSGVFLYGNVSGIKRECLSYKTRSLIRSPPKGFPTSS